MRSNYVLNGRYRILHSLGEGGMANVYLAHDLILDRDVAVKLLRLDLRDDPKINKRFQREAMAATELVNDNIVSVYDVGEEHGLNYLVMEYVAGTDLKQYIKNHFPIPYQEVINIMQQVLSAVKLAHEHDIIHRDLKPQNILIDQSGHVKITDFGIAVALSEHSLTQTNTVLGSVHYLSPEQANGGMATKQSDIYSLGIILYELLTGQVPFDGETAVSIAIKHYQEEMPSVREIDPRVPQALENVVLKATAKVPANRYESAEDMADDLKTSLSEARSNEPKFVPKSSDLEKTKVLSLSDLQTDDALKQLDDDTPVAEGKQKKKKKSSKKRHRRRNIIMIVLAIIAFLLIGLGVWGSSQNQVAVPDVTGLSQVSATRKLEAANLDVGNVTRKSSSTVKKDHVIRSTPRYGIKVKKNHKVNLVLSSGVKRFTFQDYTGLSYKTVATELRNRGFTVIKQNRASNDQPAGEILAQDVASGKKVLPKETTVTFTVSTGKQELTLDNLVGNTKKEITAYASEHSINVYFSYEYSDDIDKDVAIKQDPAAGSVIKQGSNVRVTLSRGKKPENNDQFNVNLSIPFKANSTSSSSDSDDDDDGENIVYIYLKDINHNFDSVYRQMTITKTTNITLPFTLKQGATGGYKVVRDGQTIMNNTSVTKDNH